MVVGRERLWHKFLEDLPPDSYSDRVSCRKYYGEGAPGAIQILPLYGAVYPRALT